MKHVEKHIHGILEKTFKDYKTNFSTSSKESISNFVQEFVVNLSKELDLDKAYDAKQSKEVELVNSIEQALVLDKINTPTNILNSIKQLISQYKDSK